MKNIEYLFKKYTDLNKDERQLIADSIKSLQALANLSNADAFIDCAICTKENDDIIINDGDAIVIAEAKPMDGRSSYKKSVVGMIATKENEPAVHRGLHLGVPTKYMKARTQEDATVVQTVEPIYHKDRIIGVFIIEQRMEGFKLDSPRKYKQKNKVGNVVENILADGEKNSGLIDAFEEGLLFIDANGYVVFRNKVAIGLYERFGFMKDILGRKYKEICLIPYNEQEPYNNLVQEVKIGTNYLRLKTLGIDAYDISFAVIITDVSIRKIQEKELISKSVAIKEMHHRVKNNLQTIAALLRMEKRKLSDEAGIEALDQTIGRVLAISATHQLLAKNGMDDVMLNDVMSSITVNMSDACSDSNFKLDVQLHGGDFLVSTDIATTVALISNELMQNSVKHAYTGKNQGKILIIIANSCGRVSVLFKDNGCGFDPKKVPKRSLGWNIINSMVEEKLNGKLTVVSNSSGTKVKFEFNIDTEEYDEWMG